jgi:hypothetical protein
VARRFPREKLIGSPSIEAVIAPSPPKLPPKRLAHDRCGTVGIRVDRSYCSIVRDRDL